MRKQDFTAVLHCFTIKNTQINPLQILLPVQIRHFTGGKIDLICQKSTPLHRFGYF